VTSKGEKGHQIIYHTVTSKGEKGHQIHLPYSDI
jgi:hypothetical protein